MVYGLAYIGMAAALGAVCCALLGWLDSQEPFNPRKFAYSLIHAVVAGITFAAAYTYVPPLTVVMLFVAFLGGMGVDAGLNRVEGAVAARLGK